MKRILLSLVAVLASCAPLVQIAQPSERATLSRVGLTLTVDNPGPDALTGDPSRAGDGVALTVHGSGLTPDAQAAQWCRQSAPDAWACNVPEIAAGSRRSVTFTAGLITDAAAFGYRPSLGARPVLLWLPV